MGRKIKFKALSNGKLVYGMPYQTAIGNWLMRDNETKEIHPIDSDTICQFTGLKDNAGNEIYEGDIIYNDFHKERTICKWIDKHASFGFVEDKEYGEIFYYIQSDENQLRVIGNIHDK